MRSQQTIEVRRRLLAGTACGRQFYFDGLANGRTRAGEIAKKMGKVLVSEPCRHRTSTEPAYHDFRLEDPTRQLTLSEAA